ncbi:MAG: hypothetical protein ACI9MR_002248 [Myxococcota bacterium]|jgi:hypothetical protein
MVASFRLPRALSISAVLLITACGEDSSDGVVAGDTRTQPDIANPSDSNATVADDIDVESDTSEETVFVDGVTGDTNAEGGVFGDPCVDQQDCLSGWCFLGPDGQVCTRTCIESCPDGHECRPVAGSGTDVAFLCIDVTARLCQPCDAHSDCNDGVPNAPNLCVSQGDAGSFCGLNCGSGGNTCPGGYVCDTIDDQGAGVSRQCVPETNACTCNGTAKNFQLETTCRVGNAFGACSGSRFCGADGLTACDAPEAVAETCNAADDDCDGETDEDVPAVACPIANDFGTCMGMTTCAAGGLTECEGVAAVPEICDGLDQNCDGVADESFPDLDEDGTADCVDDDRDGDLAVNANDNCPDVANADQADVDFDGTGDACDPDADGDLTPNGDDCAPLNANIHPGATELCNGLDDNCNETADEGFSNLDGDPLADCVDDDDDGDGVIDESDNCPFNPNPLQEDQDLDRKGDACEDDLDGDQDPDTTDCAPGNPAIHRGAAELCNGVDDNCNEIDDEGFPDSDMDGTADCLDPDNDNDAVLDDDDNCPITPNANQEDFDEDGLGDVCDGDDDGDGDADLVDCAPMNADVNSRATEVCNGIDDNCDGERDEAGAELCTVYFYNQDNDTYGVDTTTRCLCEAVFPYTALVAGDCNDQNPQIFPNASETCGNVRDDDCDGAVDEADAIGCLPFYADGDTDTFGVDVADTNACLCGPTNGFANRAGDCDDMDGAVNPDASEVCANGKDDNCADGEDEENADLCVDYYLDTDEDLWGQSGSKRCLCVAEGQHTAIQGGDCNDADSINYPQNTEVCDDQDNNCNGVADEQVKTTYYLDSDGDMIGGFVSRLACSAPDDHVEASGDCNDFNANIYPGQDEVCNDVDDDCNGFVDDALTLLTSYRDNDGDLFAASNAASQQKCDVPSGWALAQDPDGDGTNDWDCDDSNVTSFPGAPAVCGDGNDNDCDSIIDRVCYTECPGSWPYQMPASNGITRVSSQDLDGDGNHEIVVQASSGMAVLEQNGTVAFEETVANLNYSRNNVVYADVDDMFTYGLGVQTLELLTGNGSHPQFYKYDNGSAAVLYSDDTDMYDASRFMAFDRDGDGRVEFLTTTWCQSTGSYFFEWSGTAITTELAIENTDATCQYANGRVLTNIDDDNATELIVSHGYHSREELWSGRVRMFDDLTAATPSLVCDDCFPETDFDPTTHTRYSVGEMFVFNGEVRLIVYYWIDDDTVELGRRTVARFWRFDVKTRALIEGPSVTSNTLWRDTIDYDRDGLGSDLSTVASTGMYDVNGDGYPDRIRAVAGNQITVDLFDPLLGRLVESVGTRTTVATQSVSVRAVWDMDSDGRLEIITSDNANQVRCFELGSSTWNKFGTIPPRIDNLNRTYQWDNFEPSETKETAMRIPSAVTAKGDFHAYISSAEDVDFYAINTAWGGSICLESPRDLGFAYSLTVYKANTDGSVLADGPLDDGAVWRSDTDAVRKCFRGSIVEPRLNGQYRFVVKVEPKDGQFTPFWPYWIQAAK